MGGVSNVDIDGNNALQIKAIGVVISTFETLPDGVGGSIGNQTAFSTDCTRPPCTTGYYP